MEFSKGMIVKDMHNDIGIVIEAKKERVRAMWSESCRILSVFPETIKNVLAIVNPDDISLATNDVALILNESTIELIKLKAPALGIQIIESNNSFYIPCAKKTPNHISTEILPDTFPTGFGNGGPLSNKPGLRFPNQWRRH
jgi:hypothetical protein